MPDDVYTHGHHDAVLRSHRFRTAENSAAYLLPHLKPGLRVLDVGCGPGTITADLAARCAPGELVAVDRAPEILAEAKAACAARGVDNVTVAVGDVYALDHPDDSFDVVHAHQVLQHLSDPVAALREMRRVCRPDGVVAVRDADYHAMTWYPPDPDLDRWMHIYQAVARSNDAEPDAGRMLLAWANQVGFSSVESSASVWCFADDELRAWWGDLWAERMTSSAAATQAVERDLATDDDLRAVSAAFRRWMNEPDGWFTVLHGEILARP
ncbi:MAG: methyltransferase domain-containing protein [Actinomycetota bacterium]